MTPNLLATITVPLRRLQATLQSLIPEHPLVTKLNKDRAMFRKNLLSVESNRQEMLGGSRERLLKTLRRLQKIPRQDWAVPSLQTTQRPCAMRACAQASPLARALQVCLSEHAFCWLFSDTPPPIQEDARQSLIREVAVAEGMLFDLASHLMRVHAQYRMLSDALDEALDQRDGGQGCSIRLGQLISAVLHCQYDLHAPDKPLPAPRSISLAA